VRPDRCTEKAVELAKQFVGANDQQVQLLHAVEFTELKKVEEKFKLGIHVYEPSEDGTWRLIRQPAHYEAIPIEPMTIGWYGGHAFLIKDINKVANFYACAHCNQQFTKASDLQCHADRCTSGKTEVIRPGTVVERPQSAYQKVFYPKTNASKSSIDWLEYEPEKRNLHIHQALCGHGGERWIAEAPVDGNEPSTKTVFQYHGCHFHGCSAHCKQDNARELFQKTRQQE